MERKTHYGTVTEALNAFHEQGFNIDFNIDADCIVAGDDRFCADDFDIVDVYRYEGITDPADEATVYAIQSKSGKKGVLVTGYGASADVMSGPILEKLTRRSTSSWFIKNLSHDSAYKY
jgi:hypothetical protein